MCVCVFGETVQTKRCAVDMSAPAAHISGHSSWVIVPNFLILNTHAYTLWMANDVRRMARSLRIQKMPPIVKETTLVSSACSRTMLQVLLC